MCRFKRFVSTDFIDISEEPTSCVKTEDEAVGSSSSFYWASVANAPNVLQPYWLIVLPLDVPALTASVLL